MRLSVVIPVFNEESTILEVLRRVHEVRLPGVDKEIIVVDDGSTDATRERLAAWRAAADGGATIVHDSGRNAGKGAAVRAGIARATGDVVLIQDADLELDPVDWPRMLAPLQDGSADVVYGVRDYWRAPGSRFSTRVGNAFLSAATSLLFLARIADMETAYKAIRRPVLESLVLTSDGFDFEPEITAKLLRLGHRIAQVPIRYEPRSVAQGKKMRAVREGLRALRTLVRIRLQPRSAFVREVATPLAAVAPADERAVR